MNNDILEILELYKCDDIEYYNLISDLGYDKLLDYIINLQEVLDKFQDELKREIEYGKTIKPTDDNYNSSIDIRHTLEKVLERIEELLEETE